MSTPSTPGTMGFLPIDEVVTRLGLGKATIWRLIHKGDLKAVQFSARVWRVHEDQLAAFAQGLKDGTIKIGGEK